MEAALKQVMLDGWLLRPVAVSILVLMEAALKPVHIRYVVIYLPEVSILVLMEAALKLEWIIAA